MFQILIILLERRKVTREYLSERFELSTRTISRYIAALADSGVPVKILAGKNGGYTLADDYVLHYTFFTEEEMQKLLSVLDPDDRQCAALAEKLKASHAPKAGHGYVIKQDNLLIDSNYIANPEFLRDKIGLFNSAIESERTVDLMYIDARGLTTYREIDPYTLILKDGVWYIYAYCRLRGEFRTFKLSRVKNCTITSKNFLRQASPLLASLEEDYYDQFFINLEIEFSSLALPYVQEWLGLDAITERGTHFAARAQVPSTEALFQKLLSLGSYVKVISPPYLQEELITEAQRILNKYE